MAQVFDIATGKTIIGDRPTIRRGQNGYQIGRLTLVGRDENGCTVWDCSCGTKAKSIELKRVHDGKAGTRSCSCGQKESFKGHYDTLIAGLSASTRREAYRLIGAGKTESTYQWQKIAAREIHANRPTVDCQVLSFAAHAHRKAFIESQGPEGLASIAKTAKSSARGFFNLRKQGLNKAEIHLALRETRKNIQAQDAEAAEERRLDREQLRAELEELMARVEDPALRAKGAERLADEIVEGLHHVYGAVSHRADRGFNSKEFPSPKTKAFEKSRKLIVWVYKVLADLSDSDRAAYVQVSILWKILTDALQQREGRKQSMAALLHLGIVPVKSEYRQQDWLGLGNAPAGLAPEVAAELVSRSINSDLSFTEQAA